MNLFVEIDSEDLKHIEKEIKKRTDYNFTRQDDRIRIKTVLKRSRAMIKKIISGGKYGVEQAALDIAIKMDIVRGGWITSRQKEELGKKAERYGLSEMPNVNYARVAEHNISISEGVLIISRGELITNAALHQRVAQKFKRPCLLIDLNKTGEFQASEQINAWIVQHRIRILNITGPEERDESRFYDITYNILETVFLMLIAADVQNEAVAADDRSAHALSDIINLPKTLEEAADMLAERLTFREKTKIANMPEHKLSNVAMSLGPYIRSEFRLDRNDNLMASCRRIYGSGTMDDAILLIIERTWRQLQKANVLRVVRR